MAADLTPSGLGRSFGVIFMLLVALSSGCAFEVQSVGPGNGGLEGDGVLPGVDDRAVDATPPDLGTPGVELEVSAPITGTETATPDTELGAVDPDSALSALRPSGIAVVGPDTGSVGEVVIKEPQCTPATEKTSCPGTSCHPKTLTCTALAVASRLSCESCFADSNCADPDHRCVKMTYYGETFPDELSGFCLQIAQPTTVDGGYDCAPPFAVPLLNRVSVSGGKSQDYCGLYEKLTSCPAVLAFQRELQCPNGRDDECPDGGLCRELVTSGKKTQYRCTHACDGDAECSDEWNKVECAGFCGG